MYTKKYIIRILNDLRNPKCQHGMYPYIHRFLQEIGLHEKALDIFERRDPRSMTPINYKIIHLIISNLKPEQMIGIK